MSDKEGSEEKILVDDQVANEEPDSSSDSADAGEEGTFDEIYR